MSIANSEKELHTVEKEEVEENSEEENEEDAEEGNDDEDDEEENDQDIDEELIAAIRANPILWDHTRNDFKKGRDLKAGAWKAIAKSLKKTDVWCKQRWEKLRHSFSRKKKSLKGKTGQARKKILKALESGHFLLMKFLDDVPHEASTSSNFVDLMDSQLENDDDVDKEIQLNDKNQTAQRMDNFLNKTEQTKNQMKDNTNKTTLGRRKRQNNEVEQGLLDFLKKPKDTQDEFHHFGMNIAEQLRKLEPGFAQYVKMTITRVIYECMFPPPPPQNRQQ